MTAEKIIRVSLPSITDIYSTRCTHKANSIVDDPTHPSHTLFTLLPSGKRSLPARQLDLLECLLVFCMQDALSLTIMWRRILAAIASVLHLRLHH
ncbi:hypothetical protein QTP70_016932 [Hemibagrus guttatus]|uniref:Uncharacterized protein n=1 Tax=Hemibagrus guttatus TaxID=175788 RepID=A0AAE0V4S5_9TELE|nr:hypothetical protein QTP70_016932 [Hemibagrus guttatus]KAK3563893.1 hypothetical protein QTP86_004828 [Hemibagrus guttatus]